MSFPARFACTLLLAAAVTSAAHAQETSPIQLALFSPVQIVAPEKSVSGVRLSLIYGRNADVTGLDWGLVNHDTGTGFAWQGGIVNMVEEDFTGWQDGAINLTQGAFTGYQSGLFNSTGSMNGVAFGVVNACTSMRGVQVGLVNLTDTLYGLQVGLANVIRKGKMPFLPIVNWSF